MLAVSSQGFQKADDRPDLMEVFSISKVGPRRDGTIDGYESDFYGAIEIALGIFPFGFFE